MNIFKIILMILFSIAYYKSIKEEGGLFPSTITYLVLVGLVLLA